MATLETWAALRAPFPPEQIGKLPKGGVTLDFVGHADVTHRLLSVDPEWSWEPMATTPEGLPVLDQFGNLWIRLTILGVTRIGVGDGKSMKECIGDAIRNGAMRFGVALDLWAKGDRSFGLAGHDAPAREQTHRAPRTTPAEAARDELRALCHERGLGLLQVAQDFADGHDGQSLKDAAENDVRRFIALVRNGEAPPADDGRMSRTQKREHNALVREVRGEAKSGRRDKTDGPEGVRLPAVPENDPWYIDGLGAPETDADGATG